LIRDEGDRQFWDELLQQMKASGGYVVNKEAQAVGCVIRPQWRLIADLSIALIEEEALRTLQAVINPSPCRGLGPGGRGSGLLRL
jgi:hypothetical protein